MSARISLGSPNNGAARNSQRRKMVLDLNAPPFECWNDVGTSSQTPLNLELLLSGAPPPESLAIDVDSIDDDVILTTPSAFAEAKYRRTRGRYNVVDVELAASEAINVNNNRNKRQRAVIDQPIIICEHVNLEGNYVIGNRKSVPHSMVPPPPPPPPEPTFSCPVCMNPLVEEMSTKCGHIFCKACIKQAIAAQGKCPTCRRKVTMKDTIRIYLPATNST